MADYPLAISPGGKHSRQHMAGGLGPRFGEPVFLPQLGLHLPRKFPYERWLAIGRQLSGLVTSSAWCLGDWLVYGEVMFSGRYREAIAQTSLDYQTLRNYAWVAKRFPLSRRRDTLSFGHHTEVAALSVPEQDFWLRKAEELGWSCKQLRRQLRDSLTEREGGVPEGATDGERLQPRARLRVELSSDQMEICQAAADGAGLSLDEWAVLALEQAARHGLVHDAVTALTSGFRQELL